MSVRFSCPACGGDHEAAYHGLENREAFDAMGPDALRDLREQVVDELVAAVRGGAERGHLDGAVFMLDRIDPRLEA